MSAPREPRDSTNAIQNSIIDDLRRRLLGIRAGASVTRGDGSTYTFATTIRQVYENPESITSIDDCALPAALVWMGGEETLAPHNAGYACAWTIDVSFALRDARATDDGKIALVPRMLNVAKVDALHALQYLPAEYPSGAAAKAHVGWTASRWVIDGYDSRIGMGTLSIAAIYREII